jgi:hypothetical protein
MALNGSMTEQEPNPPVVNSDVGAHHEPGRAIPRADSERAIVVEMGWLTPEQFQVQRRERLRQLLHNLHVSERHTDYLLRHYSLDRIQQQLDWLPHRTVKKPAAFIVAAIRHNYELPAPLFGDSGGGSSSETAANSSSPSLPPEQTPNP